MTSMAPGLIRMNNYATGYFNRVEPDKRRAILEAIPHGYTLNISAAGDQFSARLFRDSDGEEVAFYRASRIDTACERVLAECVWMQTA